MDNIQDTSTEFISSLCSRIVNLESEVAELKKENAQLKINNAQCEKEIQSQLESLVQIREGLGELYTETDMISKNLSTDNLARVMAAKLSKSQALREVISSVSSPNFYNASIVMKAKLDQGECNEK